MTHRPVSFVVAAALAMAAAPALAATAMPASATATGARPGNVIGTDQSLPTSTMASNIIPRDTHSDIAPRLPNPAVGTQAAPMRYLRAAERDLSTHRTGVAQQALEMAETRLLDRSVPMQAAGKPDQGPVVSDVSDALRDLGKGNMPAARQQTGAALAMLNHPHKAANTSS